MPLRRPTSARCPAVQREHPVGELLRRARRRHRRVAAHVGEHRGHQPFAGGQHDGLGGLGVGLVHEVGDVQAEACGRCTCLVPNARGAGFVGVPNGGREQLERRFLVPGLCGRLGDERAGLPRPEAELRALQPGERARERFPGADGVARREQDPAFRQRNAASPRSVDAPLARRRSAEASSTAPPAISASTPIDTVFGKISTGSCAATRRPSSSASSRRPSARATRTRAGVS